MINKYFILALLLFSTMFAYAGGYRVSLQGGRALAMGHTGVAIIDNAEAAFFNPSGLVFLQNKWEFAGGVSFVSSKIKWQNEETGQYASTKNPVSTPMYIYSNYQINDRISVGLSVFTPYGSVVEYDKDWAGSHLVNLIDLSAFYLQPHFSYKISDKLSVGAGPIMAIGGVEFNKNLNRTLTDFDGNRSNVTIEASGVIEFGWHASATYLPMDGLVLGASYRSEMIMKVDGEDAKFYNIPDSPRTPYEDTKFKAELPLPAELLVGASYSWDKWTVAFDYGLTFWNAYKSLDVEFKNPPGKENEPPFIDPSSMPRNYKNSAAYRFGAQYQLNDKLALRAGYYFDETPVQKGYFAPETPRTDSHNITLGAGYNINKNLRVEVALLYIYFDETKASYDHYQEDGVNVPFAGSWKTTGFSPSFGLTYRF